MPSRGHEKYHRKMPGDYFISLLAKFQTDLFDHFGFHM
uniref:Uncharacterized protein n=1 Tax=Lepeophtheirus salmonis TaxID=72036 RepID=A0A0K2TFX2_LEPSM